MKSTLVFIFTALFFLIICIAFISPEIQSNYQKKYFRSLENIEASLKELNAEIKEPRARKEAIKARIHNCREVVKGADTWLRYFAPVSYKKLNGPLPVEWETEVFEKTEKPYRREGAGLALAELYMDEENFNKDSLAHLIEASLKEMVVYHADSVTDNLHTADHFFFANRLFILNLSALYTTGFECPDTSRIVPEMRAMLKEVKTVYAAFNESFPDKKISSDYLSQFDKTIEFVNKQSDNYSLFNNFEFIREYINPLFALNQRMINDYKVVSISFIDYTLNNKCFSIFDKALYRGQNTLGVYFIVKDEKAISDLTEAGRQLFFDPIISGNNKRSCASCHKADQLFADTTLATSRQFEKEKFLPRNTPSLINVVFQHLLMLDGRHTTLQNQAKDVTTNPIEMGGKENEIVEKILSCKDYKKIFSKYLKYTPQFDAVKIDHIVSAITMYYGRFSFYTSPFDDAMNKKTNADPEVISGFNLFMGKAQCGTCHFIPQFNGAKPPFVSSEFEVLGVPNDRDFKSISNDLGRYNKNPVSQMKHAFRTNTVRNTQYTAPYMYNGVFRTMEEVIDFYAAGGGVGKGLAFENQTLSSDSIKLSPKEKKLLIKFINSLSENIPPVVPPKALPQSTNALYNNRKTGGEY